MFFSFLKKWKKKEKIKCDCFEKYKNFNINNNNKHRNLLENKIKFAANRVLYKREKKK